MTPKRKCTLKPKVYSEVGVVSTDDEYKSDVEAEDSVDAATDEDKSGTAEAAVAADEGNRGARPSDEKKWNEMFERLCAYHEKYGSCSVPGTKEGDIKLANWVRNQRMRKNNLSADRLQKLNSLNFSWAAKTRNYQNTAENDAKWYAQYEELQAFQKESGHLRVPWDSENEKLSMWVVSQRSYYKAGSLTKKRKDLLDLLGFDWVGGRQSGSNRAKKDTSRKGGDWNSIYKRLKAFKSRNGHTDFHSLDSKESRDLAEWVGTQRTEKAAGLLSSDKQKLLYYLGLKWEEDATLDPNTTSTDGSNLGVAAYASLEGILGTAEAAPVALTGVGHDMSETSMPPLRPNRDSLLATYAHRTDSLQGANAWAVLASTPTPKDPPAFMATSRSQAAKEQESDNTDTNRVAGAAGGPRRRRLTTNSGGFALEDSSYCTSSELTEGRPMQQVVANHGRGSAVSVAPDPSLASLPSNRMVPTAAARDANRLDGEDQNAPGTRSCRDEESAVLPDAQGSMKEAAESQDSPNEQSPQGVNVDSLTDIISDLGILEDSGGSVAAKVIHQCEVHLKFQIKRAMGGRAHAKIDIEGSDAFSRLYPLVEALVGALDLSTDEHINIFKKCERFLDRQLETVIKNQERMTNEEPSRKRRKIKIEEDFVDVVVLD